MAESAPSFPHLLNYFPAPVETLPVQRLGPTRPLRVGETFTVVTWNLQFCASRAQRFFYEGGKAVRVAAPVVRRTIDAVARKLREFDADLVLLQEVDRVADRTARIDQVAELLEQAPYPNWVGCSYHKSRFVPTPWPIPMGKVDLWEVILSRFPLADAQRIALPLLKEHWFTQRFNLKRALLSAQIPMEGGAVHVGNVHLSAWSFGDGTVPKQIAQLREWMDNRKSWVLGGDFNALPPNDTPSRLGDVAKEYADASPPMAELIPRYRSVIPPEELLEPRHRSYLPPGEEKPNRLLDYVFVSPAVEVLESRVIPVDTWITDHWPVWTRLRIGS